MGITIIGISNSEQKELKEGILVQL